MGDATKIEWSEATWNPVVGCAHVSPGCDNCYAAREASGRLRGVPIYSGLAEAGKFTGQVRLVPERLDQPLKWKRPRRIFVNSMSDLFHKDVPMEFIAQVWGVMLLAADRHVFQVLTKRPQRMAQVLMERRFYDVAAESANEWPDRFYPDGATINFGLDAGPPGIPGQPPPNVWLGTSIESDRYAFRADHLRRTPAAVRWLSLEPLLGPLPSLDLTGIDWVVVGGESGPGARPMHSDWARDIRDRCQAAGVPFFFKQWGEWGPAGTWRGPDHHLTRDGRLYEPSQVVPASDQLGHGLAAMHRWGKKAAGRVLDGRTWDQYPEAAA